MTDNLGGYTREALAELLERATPGPWEFRDGRSRDGDSIEILMAEIGKAAEDEDPEYGYVFGEELPEAQVSANWQLAQAARTALPDALQRIAELTKERDEADILRGAVIADKRKLEAQHQQDQRNLDAIAEALGQPKDEIIPCPTALCVFNNFGEIPTSDPNTNARACLCYVQGKGAYRKPESANKPKAQPDQLAGMVRELRISQSYGHLSTQNDKLKRELAALRGLLISAQNQIEYMQEKFQATGSGNQVLAQIREALAARANSGDAK